MKKLIIASIAAAIAFSPSAFAQAKKKEPAKPADAPAPAAKEDAKPAADAKKPAADAKAPKPLPMNSRADEIDAAGKSFTQVNKDGKKVKHIITDATEIKQGDAAAKFEDIKVGDTIAGLRNKKNDDGTEYEVVKITKFGAKAPAVKKDAPAKHAPAKDAPKKDAPKKE